MKLLNRSNTFAILPRLQSADISVGRAIELLNEVLELQLDGTHVWVERLPSSLHPQHRCGVVGVSEDPNEGWLEFVKVRRRSTGSEGKKCNCLMPGPCVCP